MAVAPKVVWVPIFFPLGGVGSIPQEITAVRGNIEAEEWAGKYHNVKATAVIYTQFNGLGFFSFFFFLLLIHLFSLPPLKTPDTDREHKESWLMSSNKRLGFIALVKSKQVLLKHTVSDRRSKRFTKVHIDTCLTWRPDVNIRASLILRSEPELYGRAAFKWRETFEYTFSHLYICPAHVQTCLYIRKRIDFPRNAGLRRRINGFGFLARRQAKRDDFIVGGKSRDGRRRIPANDKDVGDAITRWREASGPCTAL